MLVTLLGMGGMQTKQVSPDHVHWFHCKENEGAF